MMTAEEMIAYWMRGAQEDVQTAEALFASKRYVACLFYCHLFVEKILKAVIVGETGEPAPYGHKLLHLGQQTKLAWSKEQLDLLDELTRFNIRARYEDYKFSLHKRATEQFTETYLAKAKDIYLWIQQKM